MKSMTGFGKGETNTKEGKIVVEARSENHRFLDIKIQLPDSTLSAEQQLSDAIKKSILRGKIRITVGLENIKSTSADINIDLAKQYKKSLDKLKKELGIDEPTRLEHYIMIKDIFSPNSNNDAGKNQIADLEKTLIAAIKKLDETRKLEGRKLEKDIKARLQIIDKITQTIKTKRKNFMKATSLKLKQRIEKLIDDTQIDETRLYQETAFLAERSDITEELVRLKAHIGKFRETTRKQGSIGKEMDFLLQEMNREAGTISAKAKDAEISHLMITFRAELEKIREQVQNIE